MTTAPGSTPLHVVHVVATAEGATWMYRMLRDLRARGYRVTAIISGGSGSLARVLANEGIPYHVLDLEFFDRRLWLAGRRLFALVALLRSLRPDVVQYHLFSSMILGRFAAWLADVPARFSMIPGPYHLEAPVLGDIDLKTAWIDSKVIAACEYTRKLYTDGGISRERVALVYYGQDHEPYDPARADGARVRRELGIAEGRPVIGDVAYFYPRLPRGPFTPPHLIGKSVKGHDVLLRAVPRVLESCPEALFLLVGEGWGPDGREYQAGLKALARELGVEHAVMFAGARSDIPDVLAAFDVSVQPSINENLGGAIESQLMAVPVVVSRVGGLVDAVEDGVTGLLAAPGDPEDLAHAITRLLLDRALARRIGEAGRRRALEQFTMVQTVRDLDALYRSELAAAEERSPRERRGYRLERLPGRVLWLGLWGLGAIIVPVWRAIRRRPPDTILQLAAATDNADWFVHISRSLRAGGVQAVRAIVGSDEGSLATQLRDAGVPCDTMPLSFAPGSGRLRLLVYAVMLPVAVLRLAIQLRRRRIQILHTHIFPSILIGRLAGWLARVPYRVSMVPGPLHLEAPLTRWADRLTLWMDHRVVAGSEATYRLYESFGVTPPRLTCISYGADARRFDPAAVDGEKVRREFGIPRDAPVIGLVAYFYPPRTDWQTPPALRGRGLKGHEDFLAAARLVREHFATARFIVVGSGLREAGERYRQAVMDRCRAQGLGDAVIFTGHRDDVPDVLATMNVAVQCSLSENYGGTIEALLLERPTVATRVGGMPETVRDGETGLLVPPRDPEALAAAICRLLANPHEARAMGRAGRTLMLGRFTLEATAASIQKMYDSLLSEGIGPAPAALSARESS